jgi:hypothetical protein
MSNTIDLAGATSTFLAETYKARRIAAFYVYLDNVMQANRLFACSEDAFRWLRRKVDDAAFDNRITILRRRHSLRAMRAAA